AGKDLHVDYGAVDSRRGNQRSVFHVGGLLTKDCAQQLLFSGQLRLALGRDFAHQNRSGFDLSADANDAALIQIAQHVFAYVRDVASDFFRAQLRVTRFDLELLDVNRSVIVLFHQTLGNQNRVFKVVTAPGHERDQNVAAERQLAPVGTRT